MTPALTQRRHNLTHWFTDLGGHLIDEHHLKWSNITYQIINCDRVLLYQGGFQ